MNPADLIIGWALVVVGMVTGFFMCLAWITKHWFRP